MNLLPSSFLDIIYISLQKLNQWRDTGIHKITTFKNML